MLCLCVWVSVYLLYMAVVMPRFNDASGGLKAKCLEFVVCNVPLKVLLLVHRRYRTSLMLY